MMYMSLLLYIDDMTFCAILSKMIILKKYKRSVFSKTCQWCGGCKYLGAFHRGVQYLHHTLPWNSPAQNIEGRYQSIPRDNSELCNFGTWLFERGMS